VGLKQVVCQEAGTIKLIQTLLRKNQKMANVKRVIAHSVV